MAAAPGFWFYDYETFGTRPTRDRVAQFAALRTDPSLTPIGEPEILYCAPTPDFLPDPQACLITGITPQAARRNGVCEWEFAAQVHHRLSRPQSCIAGYNNFRFDDEFTRYLFYRNALDPYAHEFRNGNSRFDLIDVLRLAFALRPDGIVWPAHDNGKPSFRLEDLAAANGIEHGRAHDAATDVANTAALARLLQRAQPKLWDWALRLRLKTKVESLLTTEPILLHVSARYPAERGCLAPVAVLGRHPLINNQYLVYDLGEDPQPFLELPANDLEDLLYTPAADLPDGRQRLPVKTVRINRVPMIAPVNAAHGADLGRIGLDLDQARRHAELLATASDFAGRVQTLFSRARFAADGDVEAALYDGFISDADRALLNRLRAAPPGDWNTLLAASRDPRIPELMFRVRARHFPETLDAAEQRRWRRQRRRRLYDPDWATITVDDYRATLAAWRAAGTAPPVLIDELESWLAELDLDELEGDGNDENE